MAFLLTHHLGMRWRALLTGGPNAVQPYHRGCRARLINAESLFVRKISGGGERAGAAPHANVTKLAVTALAFQVAGIAQLLKHRRTFPNLGQTLVVKIAGQGGKITAREDFTLIRDKRYARARQTTLGHSLHAVRMAGGGWPCVRMKAD